MLFLALLLTISLIRNISRVQFAHQTIADSRSRLEELKRQNEELKLKVEEVKSEEYIEKTARDKLGLAKEGEIVIVLPDEETIRKFAPKVEEEEDTLPDPTWRKWLKLFI